MGTTTGGIGQPGLFGREREPCFDRSFGSARRIQLDATSWIDHVPGWVTAGHETLFEQLRDRIPWRLESRRMYERTVEVPRLFAFVPHNEPTHPVVDAMACALSKRYGVCCGHRSFALYRDGRDSVAFHSDRELRDRPHALVAIATLGGPRSFRLRCRDVQRRRERGGVLSFRVGWGDLVVMGGACQRNWEHGVPKAARAAPRMALMFRDGDVEEDAPVETNAPVTIGSSRVRNADR